MILGIVLLSIVNSLVSYDGRQYTSPSANVVSILEKEEPSKTTYVREKVEDNKEEKNY